MGTIQLSPLNFRGLIASLGFVGEPTEPTESKRARRRRAIECWRCVECQEIYEWESEAEECCADTEANIPSMRMACPVCLKNANDYRDASDCCLWKDLDAATRWAIADAVEAGGSWDVQLGLRGKQ